MVPKVLGVTLGLLVLKVLLDHRVPGVLQDWPGTMENVDRRVLKVPREHLEGMAALVFLEHKGLQAHKALQAHPVNLVQMEHLGRKDTWVHRAIKVTMVMKE